MNNAFSTNYIFVIDASASFRMIGDAPKRKIDTLQKVFVLQINLT